METYTQGKEKLAKKEDFYIHDIPNPSTKFFSSNISDNADIFTVKEGKFLEHLCDEIQEEFGSQVMVVSLKNLPKNYKTTKQLATDLFNVWGIGNERENIGVLFLLVISERRLEIEIGTKLNHFFTNNWLQKMQYDLMVPHFKEGNFGAGTKEGLIALKHYFRSNENQLDDLIHNDISYDSHPNSRNSNSGNSNSRNSRSSSGSSTKKTWLLFSALGSGSLVLLYVLTRPEKCEDCNSKLEQLTLDDNELNSIQILERRMGNCDFHKVHCPNCCITTIKRKISRPHNQCSKCRNYTATKRETILSHATYSSRGEKKITNTCSYCNFETEIRESIPMKERPVITSSSSSSNSSSSSSYSSTSSGSGSSSGGGSGSSW